TAVGAAMLKALDVSRSMCATDVDPNRIAAAQEAARQFVDDLPAGTRLGLVVFSGYAQLAVAPTADHDVLVDAINALTTGRGTAVGAAMLKALDAIAEINGEVKPVGDVAPSGFPGGPPAGGAPAPAPGSAGYVADIVVLLTDGANTRGIAPLDAVAYAVERRVRIFTIGFGTQQPTALACTVEQMAGDVQRFGGGGFGAGGLGGARSPLRADNATLERVAEETGGRFYSAEDAP
ncbi:MAG: vWA domain-containing protein, partial [Acidimicrobiales bacterium]